MLQLKYNENSAVFYVNETRDIEGKALYVLLQYEISPRIFKYTAADFGITDVSKIKEIKDLGMASWMDKTDLDNKQQIRIILNELSATDAKALAQKIYDLPFVEGVTLEYDFEKLPIAIESVEVEVPSTKIPADEVFLGFAENQSIKSDITKKHPIIVKITSLSQLEEFIDSYKSEYPEDSTTKFEETLFAKQIAKYNKEFFENTTLFVAYLTAPRLCDTHVVTGFEIKGNELKVQISEIIANGDGPDALLETIMFFEQPKEKVEGITKISVTQVRESIFGVEQIN